MSKQKKMTRKASLFERAFSIKTGNPPEQMKETNGFSHDNTSFPRPTLLNWLRPTLDWSVPVSDVPEDRTVYSNDLDYAPASTMIFDIPKHNPNNSSRVTTSQNASELFCGTKLRQFVYSEWSVVGIKHVAQRGSGYFRSIIWILLIAFGFGFMIFQIRDRYVD